MRIRFFTSVVVLLAACTQSEGQPCQSDADCDDGLVCTPEDDNRGFCQKPGDVEERPDDRDSGEPMLNPDPDGGMDSGLDAGDGSTGDAMVDPEMDAG